MRYRIATPGQEQHEERRFNARRLKILARKRRLQGAFDEQNGQLEECPNLPSAVVHRIFRRKR